jgi:hypothetical protein
VIVSKDYFDRLTARAEKAEAEAERLRAENERLRDDDDYDERTYRNALNACEHRENNLIHEVEWLRAERDEEEQAFIQAHEEVLRLSDALEDALYGWPVDARTEFLRHRGLLKGGGESYRLVPNEQTTSSSSWVEGGGE